MTKLNPGDCVELKRDHRPMPVRERDFGVGKVLAADDVVASVEWLAHSDYRLIDTMADVACWRLRRVRLADDGLMRSIMQTMSRGRIPRSQAIDRSRHPAMQIGHALLARDCSVRQGTRGARIAVLIAERLLKYRVIAFLAKGMA